jgi:insulysin
MEATPQTASDWARVDATPGTPGYLLFSERIRQSPQDKRDYRLIKLENGLQVVLVHDDETDKAAASMNVCVGNFSDPVSRQFYV